MKKFFESLPVHDYTTKLSVSIVYAILASVAMNFFYQPGNIYSSGITGLAQILTTLSTKVVGFKVPVSITLYALNIPLFFVAWRKIGKKFTVFTFLTVTLTSIFMQIVPQTVLSNDPIICAIFGGAVMGSGIGFALKNGLSSGGLDIFSITIRKKTGRSVGSISMYFNGLIIFVAGYLFGWQYMFYSALSIFVSGKVTDAVYTKQKKMQVMIITKNPDAVIDGIQQKMRRGITIIHEAEGAYRHDKQTLLLTVVTRYELPSLESAMKESDPSAFVSISDNVKILGRFYEEDL
ncbi:YitT family protein [Enterococcus sp. 7E2_DIV0204]|uniref:YitT family protein n=2 Tax=Enterococcus TaxID=1350 RepID=R2TDN7_9ENTE|nr:MULTISPECIES: YitT family protein [Enterococcus]EOI03109.1 YitT family protein [Enterococcus moraviensis ATCC BAA-383]EOT74014.1 YitT family protein [Enterococcus moraviensis ATCC BAA-383]OJG67295.1 YitT family protein [Enterococcus moraviensis]OTN87862.1 YitT family protein [Enterococcus sp. 7E2_DIV0204]OTO70035.1 YitT family protein [Enterococcus sp. 12C11_DIV0727]